MPKDGKEAKSKRRDDGGPQSPWDAEQFALDAERFKALGDPTRLAVIGFLLAWEATPKIEDETTLDGATVSEIACALTGKGGKEPSALSHHLKELRHAGLVAMTRYGKNLCYRVDTNSISTLCERLDCSRKYDGETATEADTAENE
ncbi:MAG: winged helix-turn-helix transcriptional regulator [Akkermansiaceae bacterium]|nr:winged helix-turn-helix transcriptional regulator [Armatimonadota bacterium]